ncbi:hypothetical protein LCGC14_1643560, partial [marine sediment metagenome]
MATKAKRLIRKIRGEPEFERPEEPTPSSIRREALLKKVEAEPFDLQKTIGENLATQTQVTLLRKFLDEGTLQEKGFTRDIFLTSSQAAQLGYDVDPGELIRLE